MASVCPGSSLIGLRQPAICRRQHAYASQIVRPRIAAEIQEKRNSPQNQGAPAFEATRTSNRHINRAVRIHDSFCFPHLPRHRLTLEQSFLPFAASGGAASRLCSHRYSQKSTRIRGKHKGQHSYTETLPQSH